MLVGSQCEGPVCPAWPCNCDSCDVQYCSASRASRSVCSDLVGADHTHSCGDQGICLKHSHQLGILPLDVPHELLRGGGVRTCKVACGADYMPSTLKTLTAWCETCQEHAWQQADMLAAERALMLPLHTGFYCGWYVKSLRMLVNADTRAWVESNVQLVLPKVGSVFS